MVADPPAGRPLRGFVRRTWAPSGQRSPFGSVPYPNAFASRRSSAMLESGRKDEVELERRAITPAAHDPRPHALGRDVELRGAALGVLPEPPHVLLHLAIHHVRPVGSERSPGSGRELAVLVRVAQHELPCSEAPPAPHGPAPAPGLQQLGHSSSRIELLQHARADAVVEQINITIAGWEQPSAKPKCSRL